MIESDSEEDNIIRYGTPLDPYEEDEIPSKRKYQQQPDQYAVDAHGRRRFHGAFTGGFSAGYGNSVGSAEGWTPTSFKSSKSEKAQKSSQKPEDFMDEEDRSEFGIAPHHMQTRSEFSRPKRPQQQRYFDGPIPGEPVLEQLVRAVHETAAVRMLRSMGWRVGQGAGQRVTRVERREARDRHKVYGCYIPKEMRQDQPQSDDESSDSEFEYDTLFAPEDYEPYLIHRKNDQFGLGYSGLSRHSVLGTMVGEYGSRPSSSHLVMKEKGKKVSIRGQAFGVGALEAEDEDIYSTEDMSHYDFAVGSVRGEKPKALVNKEKGVNIIEGFVKATKPLPPVPSYPPPALPRDYNPLPAGAKRSRFEPTTHAPRNQYLGRHELTAEARGALLGETPLPPVTETITETNKESLLNVNVNFVSTAGKETNQEENKAEDFISIKDSGKELTNVFKPFVSDPKKQARYELFLRDKNSVLERDSNMDRLSEWERNREIAEFEQAAKLYKPLTGVMGDRFTHASEPDTLNPLSAVAKSSINYGLTTAEQIEAAKKGLYGVMTRNQVSWRPELLVCKRFNVPDPMGNRPEKPKEEKPTVSYSVFSYLESSVHDKDSFTREQSKFSGSKSLNINNTPRVDPKSDQSTPKNNQNIPGNSLITKNVELDKIAKEKASTSGFNKRMTVAELFLKESEKDLTKNVETEVTETINKFDKIDLYKSIFLSDSENEDEQTSKHESSKEKDFVDVPKNVERNLSPPRGIFANIDFDELNSWKRNADNKNITTKDSTTKGDSNTQKTSEKREKIDVTETDLYGPKIPDNLTRRLQDPGGERDIDNFKPTFNINVKERDIEESSLSSDSWVEVKETKSKKEKKNKKHKSHKHKKCKHKKNKK